jgi:hypothetical protein
VQEALSGLVKVTLNFNELQNAMVAGGFPVTLHELQRRIDHYLQEILQEITQGKSLYNVRMVLE